MCGGWGIGDWGWGIGDWGLGIGPNPQSPIPNPQSPIPNILKSIKRTHGLITEFSITFFIYNINLKY